MADDFTQVVNLKVDDSEVSKALSNIEKRAGNIQLRLKFDGPAARLVNQLQGARSGRNIEGRGALSSLIFEQRHAAKSAGALAVALDAAARSLRLFSTGLQGARPNKSATVATVQGGAIPTGSNLRLPFGRVGSFALAVPGLTQLAYMAYAPIKKLSSDSIGSFRTQNRAENALMFGMKQNGTEDSINELLRHSSEIQKKSIYGDEALLTAAAAWQPKIKGVENNKKMLDLLADYAAKVTGGGEVSAEQMKGFSQQLITALSGRSTALKYQGFDTTALEQLQKLKTSGAKVTEEMEIAALEKVLAPVRGMSRDLAKTDEGKIIQLKNAVGDLKESLGEKLQPAFTNIVQSINSNLPTIEKGFNSFGNLAVKIIDGFSRNIDKLSAFANYGLKALNVISDYPAAFAAFGTAAKTAQFALGDSKTGLLGSFGAFGNSLTKLATSTAWGLLAGEIALIGSTLYETYKQISTQNKKNKEIRENGNIRASLSKSVTRLKRGEISEERYKSAYDAAVRLDPTIAESERFNIWMKKPQKQNLDFARQKNVLVNMNFNTTNTQNNNITADSEMTAKIIKENLRWFATSQLNFTSRTAAAKAFAL